MSQAADRYQRLSSTPPGTLPRRPPRTARINAAAPLRAGPAGCSTAPRSSAVRPSIACSTTVERVLDAAGAETPASADDGATTPVAAIVFDASGITASEDLRALRDFFSPVITPLGAQRPPARPRHAARARRRPPPRGRPARAWRASCAPPPRSCATARPASSSTSRPVPRATSSPRCGSCCRRSRPTCRVRSSASASGASPAPRGLGDSPQVGRTVAVTGASRGIGAAIAETLARDGAHVVASTSRPRARTSPKVANAIGGSSLAARRHRRRRARDARRPPAASATAASTSSSTTPASRATARSRG